MYKKIVLLFLLLFLIGNAFAFTTNFDDDFSSGNYTNNWTVIQGGGFSVAGEVLQHDSGTSNTGGQEIRTTDADFNGTVNWNDWEFSFKQKTNVFDPANGEQIVIMDSSSTTVFSLRWNSSDYKLRLTIVGVGDVITSTDVFSSTGTWYDVKLTKIDTNMILYVDDVYQGSYTYSGYKDMNKISWNANWGVGIGGTPYRGLKFRDDFLLKSNVFIGSPFSISINEPSTGDQVVGTTDLNVTVTDRNQSLTPMLKVYYSATAGNYDNLIYSDTNLWDGVGFVCDSYDFSTAQNCVYQWDTTSVADGNYFIDANIYNTDYNTLASGGEFEINNTDLTANFSYVIDKIEERIALYDETIVVGTTISDWNWLVDGSKVSDVQDYNYSTTQNQDLNICLQVGGYDDATETIWQESQKCSAVSTERWYGLLHVTTFDENSGANLNEVTVNFNNNESNASNELWIDLNTLPSTTTPYTITFTKTGYGTRYFEVDLNKFSDFNLPLMLLHSGLGSDIEFKFFAPDRTTILSNAEITVTNHTHQNKYIERLTTNSQGQTTFFLNLNDSNYNFSIIYEDTTYDYNAISLTINEPRDEADGTIIDANWNYVLSGLAASSDTNISDNSVTLALYANTLNTYIVTVGSNKETPTYENRRYEYTFRGNDNETLTPYLLQTDDASTIKLITEQVNGLVETRYAGVEIKIYKQLTGTGRSLIEQVVTDAKGEAFVTLKAGDTYEFELYVDGEIKTFNDANINFIKIAGATIVFSISIDTTTIIDVSQYGFGITWNPTSQALQQQNTGTKAFTQTLSNTGGANISAYSVIIQNGVELSYADYNGSTNTIFTHNVNWSSIDIGELTVSIRIIVDSNQYDHNYVYTVSGFAGGYFDPIEGLKSGTRSDFGCDATGVCEILLFLAIIISLGIAGFGFIGLQLGTQSTAILFIAPMILFTYLTWVPLALTVGIVIVGFAFMLNDRRGS